ncbi:hypothetical protein KIN20_002776 [Parelaphostrongylus tenuis]|uniref:Homeobox domain-containing protein n=1 Tax=Parelaphostrongylus tenuis TaxID=148309 RepID=A0AAD5QD73_PARTN|nr:hypothetical protein KIN20_002776 [Parelaphostrongylus tenuis]
MQSFAIDSLIGKELSSPVNQGPVSSSEGDYSQRELRVPTSSSHHHAYVSQDPREDSQIRRYRTAFSREQIGRLEREFAKENYVSRKTRGELAAELNLPEGTIKAKRPSEAIRGKRQRVRRQLFYNETENQPNASEYETRLSHRRNH